MDKIQNDQKAKSSPASLLHRRKEGSRLRKPCGFCSEGDRTLDLSGDA